MIKYYDIPEQKKTVAVLENTAYDAINQIAKVANESGSVYQKDIEDLQEEFKYFRTAMQSYLFPISPTYIS